MLHKHFWQWHQEPRRPSHPVGLCHESAWGSGLHDGQKSLSLKANQQEICRHETQESPGASARVRTESAFHRALWLWNGNSDSAISWAGNLISSSLHFFTAHRDHSSHRGLWWHLHAWYNAQPSIWVIVGIWRVNCPSQGWVHSLIWPCLGPWGPRQGGLCSLGVQHDSEVNSLPAAASLLAASLLEHGRLFFGWKSEVPYANPAMQVNHFQLASNE